jgi:tubulin--tyrosine ligase
MSTANEIVNNRIRKQVHDITGQLFAAFENEYTVFSPMSNCFELFGLDFLISEDDNFQVSLLEVNPGPDFKQTGGRLKAVIEDLFEDTLRLVVDPSTASSGQSPRNMSLVYDNEWSVARMQGGMQFK